MYLYRQRFANAASALAACCACVAALAAPPALPPIVDPPTHRHVAGKFVWFDLATIDPAAAQRFYATVFGWDIEPVAGTAERYALARSEGVPVGGIFRPLDPPRGARNGARWLSFVSVADVDRAVARLTTGGAKVLVPPTTVAGRGRHAVLRDSQGAVFGVLQSATGDPPDEAVGPGEFFWVDLYTRDVQASAREYAAVGFEITTSDVADDRLLLVAGGYARGGLLPLPADGREPGWLPYVQVDDVGATLAKVRAAGGSVLREPSADVLDGRLAVIADPQGGVLGIIHWPVQASAEARP